MWTVLTRVRGNGVARVARVAPTMVTRMMVSTPSNGSGSNGGEPKWVTGDSASARRKPKPQQARSFKDGKGFGKPAAPPLLRAAAGRNNGNSKMMRSGLTKSPFFQKLSSEDKNVALTNELDENGVRELADLLDAVRSFEPNRLREITEGRQAAEADAEVARQMSLDDSADPDVDSDADSDGDIDDEVANLDLDNMEMAGSLEELGLDDDDLANLEEQYPGLREQLKSGQLKVQPVRGRAVDGTDVSELAADAPPDYEEMLRMERAKRKVPEGKDLVIRPEEVSALLQEGGGIDINVIDVSKKCTFTQAMIVVQGRSRMHMLSLADSIIAQFARRINAMNPDLPCDVEGREGDEWMCIDCGVLMVHVMSEKGRAHWKIDELWENRPETIAAETVFEDKELQSSKAFKIASLNRHEYKRARRREAQTDEEVQDFGPDEPLTPDFYDNDEPKSENSGSGFYRW